MNLLDSYRDLAQAFAYPWDREALLLTVKQIAECLEKNGRENPLAAFIEFITRTDLAGIQEEYVSTFDLAPACAPYVGHHLFGDNHKKGEYMIRVKGIYREHGFHPPESELPDHLSVMFDFMAHLSSKGAEAERREFAASQLLQGVKKMQSVAVNKPDMHWRDVISAARIICTAECEEVTPC